jgi:hypothetical protein
MKRFRGFVKNNVVVLENGIRLPEGTEVVVRLRRKRTEEERRQAFERVRRNPITHYVGMDEIIEEDKREREERFDYLFGGPKT